jgi:hypothetical protein
MTTITIATPKPDRKMLAEVFGQNQAAVRFLESMARDITVNLPDAINGSSGAEAFQFLLVQVNGQVPATNSIDGNSIARMAFDTLVAPRSRNDLAMFALLDSIGRVAQPPGNYQAKQALVGFSEASTTGTSLTNGVTANATSINLSAGTWDISGTVVFNSAASTVIEQITAGVATVSATLGTPDTYQQLPEALSGTAAFNLDAPLTRVTLANAGTVYLVAQAIFNTSTMTADGYIKARPALA